MTGSTRRTRSHYTPKAEPISSIAGRGSWASDGCKGRPPGGRDGPGHGPERDVDAVSKIGIAFSGGLTASEIADCAARAESLGYESVWVAEGHGGDQFAILAACALRTRRIRLGTAISSVFVRTAPTIAMSAATVDELSGGRFVLGLGSSHRVQVGPEHGVEYAKPIDRVRDTVAIIRTLLREGEVRHAGETVRNRRLQALVPALPRGAAHLPFRPVPEDAGALRRDRGRGDPHPEHARERGGGAGPRRGGRRAGGRDAAAIEVTSLLPASVAPDRMRRSPPPGPVSPSTRASFPATTACSPRAAFPARRPRSQARGPRAMRRAPRGR